MTYMDEYRGAYCPAGVVDPEMAHYRGCEPAPDGGCTIHESPDPTTLIHVPVFRGDLVSMADVLTGLPQRPALGPITVTPLCGSTKGATGPGVTCPACKAMKEEMTT